MERKYKMADFRWQQQQTTTKTTNGYKPPRCKMAPPITTSATANGGGAGGGKGKYESIERILRSTVPFLLFLFVYGINGRVRILPRASDTNCVTLHNVSAFEYYLFPVAPHRIISSFHSPLLDVLSALPYLLHYLIPVFYPGFLYLTGRHHRIARFYWLLGWCVWAHYIVWFLFPTAPPWVYDNRDDEFHGGSNVVVVSPPPPPPPPIDFQHREGCAFARLDNWTGLPFFYSIFAGNPVPFASFPSCHAAWPMCVLVTLPTWSERRLFAFYIVWVGWATMYSCHHFLSDIVAAILVVLLLTKSMDWFKERRRNSRSVNNALDNCLTAVILQ